MHKAGPATALIGKARRDVDDGVITEGNVSEGGG